MQSPMLMELDFEAGLDLIEEMRLRTWARQNYAPSDERETTWHPIILDEMHRIDQEL
ncbi:MAG: hypothetical protein WEB58_16785 [Planctomycetaceae bacterium]